MEAGMDGPTLSMDLRSRLLAAVDDGMSCRVAAARFGVEPSTAIRWQAQRRESGDFSPKPQGGDMRSRRIEERGADVLAIWEARKDIPLAELRLALIEIGLHVSIAGLLRFFALRDMTRKKDWPCRRARPSRHPEAAPGLVRRPDRSGTGASCVHRRNMDRHLHDPQPWTLPKRRAAADGLPVWPPQDHHARGRAAHELRPGDVVVMDNLSSHKRASARRHIKAAGAHCAYFRPTARISTPL
jgi:transposase